MQTAGYVLAGGASSRMGVNKAFLTPGGRTLIEMAAAAVRDAAGSVTIVGRPDIYERLGIPVIPDRRENAGPLAGIEAALADTSADWNLIVACDMPGVTAAALCRIVQAAAGLTNAGCVLPVSQSGRAEPLCAMYHKRHLPVITEALTRGIRKVTDALPAASTHYIRMTDDPIFQNINTPEEWRAWLRQP